MKSSDDITWNYHKGHPLSSEANAHTRKEVDRAELYRFVFAQGIYGATADEADQALGKGHQTTSARFSDLKRAGELIDTGQRRKTRKHCKAAVFVARAICTVYQQPSPAISTAYQQPSPNGTPLTRVVERVADFFHLPVADLKSKKRTQHVAFCRQVAMYLCRKLTASSFPTIGGHFGRDHSTVVHATKLIQRRIASDAAFRLSMERIELELNPALPKRPAQFGLFKTGEMK